jgi:hypothetical protein
VRATVDKPRKVRSPHVGCGTFRQSWQRDFSLLQQPLLLSPEVHKIAAEAGASRFELLEIGEWTCASSRP